MDWIQGFVKRFEGNQLISTLERVKFHGKLEINFADGVPNTCHINWCVKPYSSITLTEGKGEKSG